MIPFSCRSTSLQENKLGSWTAVRPVPSNCKLFLFWALVPTSKQENLNNNENYLKLPEILALVLYINYDFTERNRFASGRVEQQLFCRNYKNPNLSFCAPDLISNT